MKADKLGVISALVASVCCVTPLLLVLLGLGSLGIGAALGRFHWWFLLATVGLLAYGWWAYGKEQGRCQATHCEMPRSKTTRTVLTVASVIVATFVGLNLYTYASQSRTGATATPGSSSHLSTVTILVEGMTCFTCELTVESSLEHLPGVQEADAKVTERAAYVRYDPTRVSLDELVAAINKTGYRARQPK